MRERIDADVERGKENRWQRLLGEMGIRLQVEDGLIGRFARLGICYKKNVRAYDLFSMIDKIYTVMEFMKGGTLWNFFNAWKKLPEPHSKVVAKDLL